MKKDGLADLGRLPTSLPGAILWPLILAEKRKHIYVEKPMSLGTVAPIQ